MYRYIFPLAIGRQSTNLWCLEGFFASPPIVTIFGGSHFDQSDIYAKQAHELARKFADEGVSVLTGGGVVLCKRRIAVQLHRVKEGKDYGD